MSVVRKGQYIIEYTKNTYEGRICFGSKPVFSYVLVSKIGTLRGTTVSSKIDNSTAREPNMSSSYLCLVLCDKVKQRCSYGVLSMRDWTMCCDFAKSFCSGPELLKEKGYVPFWKNIISCFKLGLSGTLLVKTC